MEVTSPSSSCSTEPAREVTDTKQPTCRATSSWISWHMVYNINHRGVPCLESLRLQLEQMITKYNKCNKSEAWPRDELHGAGGSSPLEFIWISILVGRRNQHEPTITTHIQNCSLEGLHFSAFLSFSGTSELSGLASCHSCLTQLHSFGLRPNSDQVVVIDERVVKTTASAQIWPCCTISHPLPT